MALMTTSAPLVMPALALPAPFALTSPSRRDRGVTKRKKSCGLSPGKAPAVASFVAAGTRSALLSPFSIQVLE